MVDAENALPVFSVTDYIDGVYVIFGLLLLGPFVHTFSVSVVSRRR